MNSADQPLRERLLEDRRWLERRLVNLVAVVDSIDRQIETVRDVEIRTGVTVPYGVDAEWLISFLSTVERARLRSVIAVYEAAWSGFIHEFEKRLQEVRNGQ